MLTAHVHNWPCTHRFTMLETYVHIVMMLIYCVCGGIDSSEL